MDSSEITKKPFYKKGWFFLLIFIIVIAALIDGEPDKNIEQNITQEVNIEETNETINENIEIKQNNIMTNIDDTITKLSTVGIGQLGTWKSDGIGGYMAITSYKVIGANNNLAIYFTGLDKEKANKIDLTLNINTPSEKNNALSIMSDTAEKICSVLEIGGCDPIVAELKKGNISNGGDSYLIFTKKEISNIETYHFAIQEK